MFTWVTKQGVKSEKEFVVQSVDRFTIEYREGVKIISVEVDRGFLPDKKLCVNIKSNAFQNWNDGTPVDDKRQTEILQNFKDAMEFQGIAVIVN